MPQPGQGHCKNFQTFELNLSKSKKTCLKSIFACNLKPKAKDNAKDFEES